MTKKEEKLIMAVKRNLLFQEGSFEGFKNAEERDYQKRILDHFEYIKRRDVEKDSAYKQPIGYAVLINLNNEKIFAYQRSSQDENYSEKRLQGKWSWGVGGHIDKPDKKGKNPIKTSLLRELEEEVEIKGEVKGVEALGYINDDSDSVGKVHFGILYLVKVTGDVSPKDSEMGRGEMKSLKELREVAENTEYNTEEWSKISLKPIEKFLT